MIRRTLKRAVFGISFGLATPGILVAWLERKTTRRETLFVAFAQLFSLLPGALGVHVRAAFYWASLERCSWETHVGFGSLFTHRAATMGANVSMGSYCVLGHVDLGAGVIMASRVSIPSGKRQHFDEQGHFTVAPIFERVTIGPQTWIGEGAIILADVGRRCIVSAGAVVSKVAGEGCLIGGNPARVIKQLDGAIYAEERAD